MPYSRKLAALFLVLMAHASPALAQTFARHDGIKLEVAADGFDHPVFLCGAPGDTRLFVVEQPGRIRWIEKGKPSAALFADLTSEVRYGGERGLLGLAFHPDYVRNGWVFVNFTDKSGDTQVMRYTVKRDRSALDLGSALRVLTVKQPFANHNGGHIAFGPDGMLYIGMGDGGAGGDPLGNGQNRHALLGKMLRIDVTHGTPYTIPAGNPFKSKPRDGAPEIWSMGMRNPWRWSFDFAAKRLIIADVGQNKFEEVNVVDAATPGLNYGWNVREALHGFGLPRP
ncbi:MAG: PQQ-dependent sugar dehydrogenase, partial [Candidatus Eisenbacteria bacterium]